jgi:hypothetical protein
MATVPTGDGISYKNEPDGSPRALAHVLNQFDACVRVARLQLLSSLAIITDLELENEDLRKGIVRAKPPKKKARRRR